MKLKCEDEEVIEEIRCEVEDSSYVARELDKFFDFADQESSLKLNDPYQRKKELVRRSLEEYE